MDNGPTHTAPSSSGPTNAAPSSVDFASHMHLVLGIVAQFMRKVPRSVQREDLVAAGSMGLLHALRSNQHTCPEMFVAYARIRIRGAVIDELRRQDWMPRRRRTPETNAVANVKVTMPAAEAVPAPKRVVVGFEDLQPAEEPPADGRTPLEEIENRVSNTSVRNAVLALPERERQIVSMRFFDDVPSKAIASTLGVSEARISQLLTRAIGQLRRSLDHAA
jgi:RNA polymerase sigma factor for flagellar operon FliA